MTAKEAERLTSAYKRLNDSLRQRVESLRDALAIAQRDHKRLYDALQEARSDAANEAAEVERLRNGQCNGCDNLRVQVATLLGQRTTARTLLRMHGVFVRLP